MTQPLIAEANGILERLCVEIDSRRLGSPGNRAATTFFADSARSHGFRVETQEFDCLDWAEDGAELAAGETDFAVQPSPYSPGVRAEARLAVVSNLAELAEIEAADAILLVRGDLAREQLMPVDYPFYYPEEHGRIHSLLRTKNPPAIVAATSRNPELAGAVYPFPLIEDGKFDIPSVYMTEEEGDRLAAYAGATVRIESRARRIPSTGCNVVARVGSPTGRRVVFTAHIDAKRETPGALDNAAGVTVLLLLAELLQGYVEPIEVELVAINGEDHYAAAGELRYLEENGGRMDEIVLNVNLDALGYIHGATHFSLYDCPDALAGAVRATLAGREGIAEGDAWYQGDHMMFVQNGAPALAVTSENFAENGALFHHTERDTPDLVDPARLADAASALRDLCLALPRVGS